MGLGTGGPTLEASAQTSPSTGLMRCSKVKYRQVEQGGVVGRRGNNPTLAGHDGQRCVPEDLERQPFDKIPSVDQLSTETASCLACSAI